MNTCSQLAWTLHQCKDGTYIDTEVFKAVDTGGILFSARVHEALVAPERQTSSHVRASLFVTDEHIAKLV